jgi:hypothetical protein
VIALLSVSVADGHGGWRLRRVSAHLGDAQVVAVVSHAADERRALLDTVSGRLVPEEGRAWPDPAPHGARRARVRAARGGPRRPCAGPRRRRPGANGGSTRVVGPGGLDRACRRAPPLTVADGRGALGTPVGARGPAGPGRRADRVARWRRLSRYGSPRDCRIRAPLSTDVHRVVHRAGRNATYSSRFCNTAAIVRRPPIGGVWRAVPEI